MLFVYTSSTAVTAIKVTMQVIGVVMAVPVSNKSSQLTIWKNLGENRFRIKNKSGTFFCISYLH